MGDKNKIIDPFDKTINDLKKIKTLLESINKENFLNDEALALATLKDMTRIISNYKASINIISTIKPQMNPEDYEIFVNDLNINLNQLNRVLRKIFSVMIDESDIVGYKKHNYLENILNNDFSPLIENKSFKKIVLSKEKQKEIQNEIDSSVLYLNDIINNNELKKQTFDDIKLDIPLDMPIIKKEVNPYEEVIDVPAFVNSRYEESKTKEVKKEIDEIENYLKKFDILKNRLKEKGKYNSLKVDEVALYNKLESEILNLKNNTENKFARLKVNFYFKKVERKLKLSKDNYYKYLKKKSEQKKTI